MPRSMGKSGQPCPMRFKTLIRIELNKDNDLEIFHQMSNGRKTTLLASILIWWIHGFISICKMHGANAVTDLVIKFKQNLLDVELFYAPFKRLLLPGAPTRMEDGLIRKYFKFTAFIQNPEKEGISKILTSYQDPLQLCLHSSLRQIF